ncbi:MAG: sulfatase-like hydrolase/transferase [Verrucomicrobiales bacterium]|nr:sulfatase-like hydrolase/transferase [Verrucomicrobiales bacterium]
MKLWMLVFAVSTGLCAVLFGADSPPRPNILYIYVDDMGWGSLGPNAQFARKAAGKPCVKTPSLDALAARSINFTRAYGCTVCSPARSSQQTGFHQGHTFADRNDPDNAKKAIRADDITMGDMLSKAGYTTGYWGKWGYGGSKDQKKPTIDNIQTLPTSHGYKHVLAELHHVRAHTFFQPTLWKAPASPGATGGLELAPNSMKAYTGKPEYPAGPALQNHPDYPQTAYCDDCYCFAALDFVRSAAKNYIENGTPFFGLLAVQVPHAPFNEIMKLPEWDSAYQNDEKFTGLSDQTRQWAAMVTRIDGHIGNLLRTLEDPDGDGDTGDSISENTLVIFQSDNGGPSGPCNKELDTNGGLRGTKGTIFEGGIRVPTMMSWPAQITPDSKLQAGTNSDRVIDVSDLLPTFCELTGLTPPLGLDGVSFAPFLLGKEARRNREFIIHEAGKHQSIIRGNYKLVRSKNDLELYDLGNDRAEKNNIAKAHGDLVEELETLLLGERVDEPRGFANTYHLWQGKSGAATSKADNWSDYNYSNAGVTYLEDNGAPRLSWCAKMENIQSRDVTASGDQNLALLALEIGGREKNLELQLGTNVDLNARNELRLSSGGILSIDGGTVSSLRWVKVNSGAEIRGHGEIDASVINEGTVELAARKGATQLFVHGNYFESESSVLKVSASKQPALVVSGEAKLAGRLSVEAVTPGDSCVVLAARKISGRFSHPTDRCIAKDGTEYVVSYTENEVRVSATSSENTLNEFR